MAEHVGVSTWASRQRCRQATAGWIGYLRDGGSEREGVAVETSDEDSDRGRPAAVEPLDGVPVAVPVTGQAARLGGRDSRSASRWPRWIAAAFVAAGVVYMVAWPTAEWIMEWFRPAPSGRVLEEMSVAESVRVRVMEGTTAAWFFACGATLGSFLNVVAYRLPRGESVVFRRSRCPQCATPIAGRDNVPVLGWLLLGGRCRACGASISARYPLVESAVGGVFLVLFFVELISGGANIPVREPNFYRGVVWIIFYTKWDLVGMYGFHMLAIAALFTWTLLDIDRQTVPAMTRLATALLLFVLPVAWPGLLPVAWAIDPAWRLSNPWLGGAATAAVGGLAGWLIAWCASRATGDRGHAASAGLIAGMTLGWQAAIGVGLLALVLRCVAVAAARWRRWPEPPLTAWLLAAYCLQLIAWRWSAATLAGVWPGPALSWPAWIVTAAVFASLCVFHRLVLARPPELIPAPPTLTAGPAGGDAGTGDILERSV